jgi:hypothetical protein
VTEAAAASSELNHDGSSDDDADVYNKIDTICLRM